MKTLSNLLRRLMRTRLSGKIIPWYAGYFQIDLSQLDRKLVDFPHLESFFTRQLIDGARPFDESIDVLVSPVDGMLSVVSDISLSDTFIVKGKTYHLAKLLGSSDLAEKYRGGTVMILYLSPADYHRIHLPLEAKEVGHYRLGRFSWPVNDWGLKWTRGLTSNYRLVSQFEHSATDFLMISVGALNVNSIVKLERPDSHYLKMTEYGYFSFGSTVILVFPPDKLTLNSTQSRKVKAGETLGKAIL